jgi:hypothetical protein
MCNANKEATNGCFMPLKLVALKKPPCEGTLRVSNASQKAACGLIS